MDEEFGLENENRPWTSEQDDIILDEFLKGVPIIGRGSHPCLVKQMHRSPKGIEGRLWKLATRYEGLEYVPHNRTDRTGLLLAKELRERWLLSLAVQETGIRFQAHRPESLSKLLSRREGVLRGQMERLTSGVIPGFFDGETSDEVIARRLRTILKNTTAKLEEDLIREMTNFLKK